MENAILIPGNNIEETITPQEEEKYLLIDNHLSEFYDSPEAVRSNLGVVSQASFDEFEAKVNNTTSQLDKDLTEHINDYNDPHKTITKVDEKLKSYIKLDGSIKFTKPQSGVDPTQDSHLATKKYVDDKINILSNEEDPYEILPQVDEKLKEYIKSDKVYIKEQTYTQKEVDNKLSSYVKTDGSTPFKAPQVGVTPTSTNHLTTKNYVDSALYSHKTDSNAHNIDDTISNKLKNYYTKSQVYSKGETYSKSEITSKINQSVDTRVKMGISSYTENVNKQLEYLNSQPYVKADGTVPFTAPQSGVNATKDEHFITLQQLKKALSNVEYTWITSGPVESTVGHIEDNTEVPAVMTFQEVCDAIFYGKGVTLEIPDYIKTQKEFPIILCVRGSSSLVESAKVYQNDKLIKELIGDDFTAGCVTINGEPTTVDATIRFEVSFTNGSFHEVSATTKCYLPVFVGLLPVYKAAKDVTTEYLEQLQREDLKGTQNRFLDVGDNASSVSFKYEFQDASLREPFIVLPESYPDLESMVTKSQSFSISAFDKITTSLLISGKPMNYKIYIYKQGLSSLNQEVTFNLNINE